MMFERYQILIANSGDKKIYCVWDMDMDLLIAQGQTKEEMIGYKEMKLYELQQNKPSVKGTT